MMLKASKENLFKAMQVNTGDKLNHCLHFQEILIAFKSLKTKTKTFLRAVFKNKFSRKKSASRRFISKYQLHRCSHFLSIFPIVHLSHKQKID